MRITYEGWDPVDRQPVRGTLTGLDRAQTQAADLVTVELSSPAAAAPAAVTIKQNPLALQPGAGGGVRVGACAWDGAYVMAAYLDAQPPGAFAGLRAVELGAGMALPGLVLARLGAAVYATDKPAAAVWARVNAGKNRLLAQQQQQAQQAQQQAQQAQQQAPPPGSVVVLPLDWEDAAAAAAAAASITADGPVDLVVGTDCIYPDPDGSVPSSSGLMAAVCTLATPGRTRALLSFEARSDALRQALLGAAAAAQLACAVQRLPPEALPEAYRAPHIEIYELQF